MRYISLHRSLKHDFSSAGVRRFLVTVLKCVIRPLKPGPDNHTYFRRMCSPVCLDYVKYLYGHMPQFCLTTVLS